MAPAVTLTAEGGWSGWGDLHATTVRLNSGFLDETTRNWRDTYRVGLSARHDVSAEISVLAGASYDSSPTSEQFRLPDLPGDRQLGFGLGLECEILEGARVTVSYAYYDLGENRIAANVDPLNGQLSGTMDESIQYFGLGLKAEL